MNRETYAEKTARENAQASAAVKAAKAVAAAGVAAGYWALVQKAPRADEDSQSTWIKLQTPDGSRFSLSANYSSRYRITAHMDATDVGKWHVSVGDAARKIGKPAPDSPTFDPARDPAVIAKSIHSKLTGNADVLAIGAAMRAIQQEKRAAREALLAHLDRLEKAGCRFHRERIPTDEHYSVEGWLPSNTAIRVSADGSIRVESFYIGMDRIPALIKLMDKEAP